jgi:hypothetical protein
VTEFRIGLPLLLLLFIISFILGMFIMHLFVKLFIIATKRDDVKEVSEEIDVLERWTVPEK